MPLADVSSEDLDLLMLMPAIPPVGWGPVSQVPVSLGVSTSQSRPVGSDGETSVVGGREVPEFVSGVPPGPASLPESQSCMDGVPLRRTGQTTAGHYSNLHHLPRAVEGGSRAATIPGPTSNRISVWFRP